MRITTTIRKTDASWGSHRPECERDHSIQEVSFAAGGVYNSVFDCMLFEMEDEAQDMLMVAYEEVGGTDEVWESARGAAIRLAAQADKMTCGMAKMTVSVS